MSWDILREGLRLGAKVSLAAIPYSLVYTQLRMFNFAFGEVITFAGYVLYVLTRAKHWPIWAALPVALLLSAALGALIERVAYRRLMETRDRHLLLVSSIGVSIVLQNLYQAVFGSRTMYLDRPETPWFAVACVLALEVTGLLVLLQRTSFGNRMAAIASNRELSQLLGINPTVVYASVFMIASALAVPAAFFEMSDNGIAPDMGFQIGMLAFAAAVLAGMHSILWTLAASFVLGVVVVVAQVGSFLNDRLIWVACVVFAILLAGLRRTLERRKRVSRGEDRGVWNPL